jgi:hypothetical protein
MVWSNSVTVLDDAGVVLQGGPRGQGTQVTVEGDPREVGTQWYSSGVTMVLQWCYSIVAVVLQWCCNSITGPGREESKKGRRAAEHCPCSRSPGRAAARQGGSPGKGVGDFYCLV